MSAVSLLGFGLASYAVAGLVTGLAFVTIGAQRVLPGAALSCGARLMILPGAAALWPYVLLRWLRGKGPP